MEQRTGLSAVKILLIIVLILTLLSFRLPYLKGLGRLSGYEYSGTELATSLVWGEDGSVKADDSPQNLYLISAFIAGIVCLTITLSNGKGGIPVAACGIFAVFELFKFKFTLFSYYRDYEEYIATSWGLTLTIICYIVVIVLALIPKRSVLPSWAKFNYDPLNNDFKEALFTETSTQPQANADKFCKQCGAELAQDATFCFKCGAPQAPSDTCTNCGCKLENSHSFCPECGTKRESRI